MNDIITLTSQSGEDIDFRHIADVKHRSYTYAILQPVILLEGMAANEALVFRVTYAGNGNSNYNIELNDKIVDAVFKKYNKQSSSNYSYNNGGFTPGDSLYGSDRAIGHPANMLLDLAVFPFLFALLMFVTEVYSSPESVVGVIILFASLASLGINCIYFLIHAVAFLMGKR